MGCLLPLLVSSFLAAEPTAVVVLSRRVSLSFPAAAEMVAQSEALLKEGGAPLLPAAELGQRLSKLGLRDVTTCGGRSACIGEIGRQLEVDWLVLVSASRVAQDRSLALELFDVASRTVVDKESVLLPRGVALKGELLQAFVDRIKARWPTSIKVPDFPLNPEVEPASASLVPAAGSEPPPPMPPLSLPLEEKPRDHTASWILGGAGALALVTSAVFLGLGLVALDKVNAGQGSGDFKRSELTGSEAQKKAQTASLELALAGAGAGVGLGLGTAAVVLW